VNYHVLFTPRARDPLNAFWWIEERSPTAAARWYAGLRRAVAKLAKMPERYPIAEESEQLGLNLRQMLYGRRR
jgi:plasmid stabilization system protein ParE